MYSGINGVTAHIASEIQPVLVGVAGTEDSKMLPRRTSDTMSEAIALSSPNGRMSKRARKAANDRLAKMLFGDGLSLKCATPQPSEKERLLRQAKTLRDLADRGMSTRKFTKEAERLEQEAISK